MREGVNALTDWCERGVRVVSVTQQVDLSGTIGHLVAGVLFAIAEIELQHSRAQQTAGIAVAKQKGIYTGLKKVLLKAKLARAVLRRGGGGNVFSLSDSNAPAGP